MPRREIDGPRKALKIQQWLLDRVEHIAKENNMNPDHALRRLIYVGVLKLEDEGLYIEGPSADARLLEVES